MNPGVEVGDPILQPDLVVPPAHPVDADRRGLLQAEEGLGQPCDIDMVEQSGELESAVLAGRLAHAQQTARLDLGPARCPG